MRMSNLSGLANEDQNTPDADAYDAAEESGENTRKETKRRVASESRQCQLAHEAGGMVSGSHIDDVQSRELTFPKQNVDLRRDASDVRIGIWKKDVNALYANFAEVLM